MKNFTALFVALVLSGPALAQGPAAVQVGPGPTPGCPISCAFNALVAGAPSTTLTGSDGNSGVNFKIPNSTYYLDNTLGLENSSYSPIATFTASIAPASVNITGYITAGTEYPNTATLVVSAVNSGGPIIPGMLFGATGGVTAGTSIPPLSGQLSGTPGGVGSYTILPTYASVGSSGAQVTMSATYGVVTVTAVASGTIGPTFGRGKMLRDSAGNIAASTYMTFAGTGAGGTGTYYTNVAQTVASEAMSIGTPGNSSIRLLDYSGAEKTAVFTTANSDRGEDSHTGVGGGSIQAGALYGQSFEQDVGYTTGNTGPMPDGFFQSPFYASPTADFRLCSAVDSTHYTVGQTKCHFEMVGGNGSNVGYIAFGNSSTGYPLFLGLNPIFPIHDQGLQFVVDGGNTGSNTIWLYDDATNPMLGTNKTFINLMMGSNTPGSAYIGAQFNAPAGSGDYPSMTASVSGNVTYGVAGAGNANAGITIDPAGTGFVTIQANGHAVALNVAAAGSAKENALIRASSANQPVQFTTQSGDSSTTYGARFFAAGGQTMLTSGTALATNATIGYDTFAVTSGVPTGVPANFSSSGEAPFTFDLTDLRPYYYGSSAWHPGVLADQATNFTSSLSNGGITSDATHTDASVCEDTTSHQFYFGSGTLGICLGTSSKRYKTDGGAFTKGLADALALQPRQFYLDKEHGDPKKLMYGFYAEEASKVLPDLVGLDTQGRANTFDYLGVVPVLVASIHELNSKIDAVAAHSDANAADPIVALNSRLDQQQTEIYILFGWGGLMGLGLFYRRKR